MGSGIVFWSLTTIIIFFATAVVFLPSPIYAALSLAGTMIALSFMYMHLDAYFIAGVQLIVYAGAVMVLFVMVLMLFDLEKEKKAFSIGRMSQAVKASAALGFVVAISWAVKRSVVSLPMSNEPASPAQQIVDTKELATALFTKYVFAFEALGVLLLIIAIGVVAVSRTKGGTHAEH